MKKTKKTRGIVELKSRYGFFFTLHWIIGIVIFFAVPLIQSIVFSFSEIEIKGGGFNVDWVGLEIIKNTGSKEITFYNEYDDEELSTDPYISLQNAKRWENTLRPLLKAS